MFEIKDKAVLITGGTAGIGLATARHFSEQGAQVVISGRRNEGEEIAQAMGCGFIQADLANLAEIDRLFEQALAMLGRLDDSRMAKWSPSSFQPSAVHSLRVASISSSVTVASSTTLYSTIPAPSPQGSMRAAISFAA